MKELVMYQKAQSQTDVIERSTAISELWVNTILSSNYNQWEKKSNLTLRKQYVSFIIFCFMCVPVSDSSSGQSVSEVGARRSRHWTYGFLSKGNREECLFASLQWLLATVNTKRVSQTNVPSCGAILIPHQLPGISHYSCLDLVFLLSAVLSRFFLPLSHLSFVLSLPISRGGRFTVIDHCPVSQLRAENCRVKLHSLQKNLIRLHMSNKALLLRTDTQ